MSLTKIQTQHTSTQSLLQFKKEVTDELISILNYWINHTIDELNGGFYGKINSNNEADTAAPKGSVLNARILWTFSSAYNFCNNENYLPVATRAYKYIIDHFVDKEYGGVFWTVDAKGNIRDSKKQIYALAFCMYGMSEYYAMTNNREALDTALQLYNEIETHSYDLLNKGYFEAFARDWTEPGDLRLSAKDANEKKTMNTHLHIIEAYANLYKISPGKILRKKIIELLEVFDDHIIDKKTFHLKLFFDEEWNEKPNVTSYGHDIEAAWLLQQCAEIIQHEEWIGKMKKYAVKITDAAAEGLDADGGLWYEYEPLSQQLIKEKHSWPQAEAMIGFFNAWQITGEEKYLQHSINSWRFISKHIIDHKNGEWFWGVRHEYEVMDDYDKVGIWKCPYHNSRACLEIMQRIS